MENLRFNYRTIQGQPVSLKVASGKIQEFEALYKLKVARKYQERLISPQVEVVVSGDCTKIINVHLLAEAVSN